MLTHSIKERCLALFAIWRRPYGVGKVLLISLLAACLLFSAYFKLYTGSLAGEMTCLIGPTATRQAATVVRPYYRFQTPLPPPKWTEPFATFFEPAHQIDRLIRPQIWKTTMLDNFGAVYDSPAGATIQVNQPE